MDDLELMVVKAASMRAAVMGRLGTLGNYVRGRAFTDVSKLDRPAYPTLVDAAGEEARELGRQRLLSRLTGRLSDQPGVHIQDRVVGGVAGGAAGLAADSSVGGHDGSNFDLARRGGALVGGAALGGRGVNAAMNVGRRYVANTSPLFGYEMKEVPRLNLRNLWRHGVKDQRAFNPANSAHEAEFTAGTEPRYELLRRYLGVHKPNAAKDYFVKNPDGSLRYNPAVVKPGTQVHKDLIEDPAARRLWNPTTEAPYSIRSSENPFRNVFGSHDTRTLGTTTDGAKTTVTRQIGDAWNFAIDPHEKPVIVAYLKGLARTSPTRWGEYLRQPSSIHHNPVEEKTVGDVLGGAGLRTVMERVLRKETPVIRSNITSTYDGFDRHLPIHKIAGDGFGLLAVKAAALLKAAGPGRPAPAAPPPPPAPVVPEEADPYAGLSARQINQKNFAGRAKAAVGSWWNRMHQLYAGGRS